MSRTSILAAAARRTRAPIPERAPPRTKAKGDCKYNAAAGFCISPPDGYEVKEVTEPVPGTSFRKNGEPRPAQNLFVSVEESNGLYMKENRADTKRNAEAIIEDIDIADGKGWYVVEEYPNNVIATAQVFDKGKMFYCNFNAYKKDKDALKDWIEACKTLRPAD